MSDPRAEFERIKARRKRAGKYERIGIVCGVCAFGVSVTIVRHHILPIAEGGKNDAANLMWLCPNCHAVVHSLKKRLTRNYFGNKQIMRANKTARWVNLMTDGLNKFYSPAQTETLWQIAEETYGR